MSLRTLLLTGLLISFTASTFAQTSPDSNDNAQNDNPQVDQVVMLLQVTLNLTASQVKSIRELAQAHQDEIASIEQKAGPKLQELQTMLDDPNSNPETVGKLALELGAIRKQVLAKQADCEKRLLNVLDSSQQQTVKNLGQSAEIFVCLKKLGLIDPDLENGIFMNGLKTPTGSSDSTDHPASRMNYCVSGDCSH